MTERNTTTDIFKRGAIMKVRRTTGMLSGGKRGELNSTVYTVEKLTEIFGNPTEFEEGGKTTMEWSLTIGDVFISIYDYRGFKWSIGGQTEASVAILSLYLGDTENCVPKYIN